MEHSESNPAEALKEAEGNALSTPIKDVRVEIRTSSERIEGYIKIPVEAQNYCKRLSDILWYADRGGTGVLTVANAYVYDLKTAKLITRQNLLGVAKSQLVYFWLLPSEEEREKPLVLEINEKI